MRNAFSGFISKSGSIPCSFLNFETSKMLFEYPVCFNSQKTKAFLIVLKNSNTLCGFSPEFLTFLNASEIHNF